MFNCALIVTPASARAAPVSSEHRRGPIERCDQVRHLDAELRTVAGVPADAPMDAAALSLLERGVQAVLVTLGAAGCRLWRRGVPAYELAGWRMHKLVDTIGAGDTFTGALAAALARGETIEQAMRCANAAAALSVTGRGAIDGMPSLSQVAALLASR